MIALQCLLYKWIDMFLSYVHIICFWSDKLNFNIPSCTQNDITYQCTLFCCSMWHSWLNRYHTHCPRWFQWVLQLPKSQHWFDKKYLCCNLRMLLPLHKNQDCFWQGNFSKCLSWQKISRLHYPIGWYAAKKTKAIGLPHLSKPWLLLYLLLQVCLSIPSE